jgi:hypothetical protein
MAPGRSRVRDHDRQMSGRVRAIYPPGPSANVIEKRSNCLTPPGKSDY